MRGYYTFAGILFCWATRRTLSTKMTPDEEFAFQTSENAPAAFGKFLPLELKWYLVTGWEKSHFPSNLP